MLTGDQVTPPSEVFATYPSHPQTQPVNLSRNLTLETSGPVKYVGMRKEFHVTPPFVVRHPKLLSAVSQPKSASTNCAVVPPPMLPMSTHSHEAPPLRVRNRNS